MKLLKFVEYACMPWKLYDFYFWGAVAGAAISLLGSKSASKGGKSSRKYQKQLLAKQVEIAKSQWETYKSAYQPQEYALGEELTAGPDYNKAQVDNARAFDKSRAIEERTIGRYGIDPSSGRFAGMEQEYGIQRARGEVDAMNREEDKQFARRLAFVQTGKGLPSTALQGYGLSSRGFSDIAGNYDKQAAGWGRTAGYFAGKAIDSYQNKGGDFSSDPSGGYGLDSNAFSDYSYPEGSGTVLQN